MDNFIRNEYYRIYIRGEPISGTEYCEGPPRMDKRDRKWTFQQYRIPEVTGPGGVKLRR